MSELLINPKNSWWEKLSRDIRGASPQVHQALITVTGMLVLAAGGGIGGCISTHSENTRLKSEIRQHELEIRKLIDEVMPFRNLAVQDFNKADAESMRKLAESMTTLRKDYLANLQTLNSNRLEIARLKDEIQQVNNRTDRCLSTEKEKEIIAVLSSLPKAKINVKRYGPDVESIRFQEQLVRVFTSSGFTTTSEFNLSSVNSYRNQFVLVNSLSNQPPCAGAIQRILQQFGIEMPGAFHMNVPTNGMEIIIGPISR